MSFGDKFIDISNILDYAILITIINERRRKLNMKYTFKNILSFIKTEKMIFVLMILCVISSSFIINFSYGLYQNYHVIKEEEESDLYEFEITFNNDLNDSFASKIKTKETVLSFSDSLNDAIDMYMVSPYIEEIPADTYGMIYIRFCIKNGKISPCNLFKENMNKYGTLVSGNYFSDEEEMNGANVVLVFDDEGNINSLTDKLKINNDTILFQEKEYSIIGVQKMHPVIVPFNSLKDDTPVNSLLFHFVKPLTRTQYDEIKDKVSANFGDIASIPELDIPESENYYLYNTIIMISILIAVLASINFAVLYQYILSKRRKTLGIFRLCGCTKFKVLRIFLSECMFITIPTFALTSLCYDKLVLPVLAKHFEYIESAYNSKMYLIIFLIYVFCSLAVLTLMIYFSYLRKTIREMWGGK